MIRYKRGVARPLGQASCAMKWLQAWAEQARWGKEKIIAGGPAHLIIAPRRGEIILGVDRGESLLISERSCTIT
jgi:hypothetical protein